MKKTITVDFANVNGLRPDRSKREWTMEELMRQHFPRLRFIVEGLIPEEGLVMFGGFMKLGKSYLTLQLSTAVGSGSPVFGRETMKRRVLYFALEDGARRLRTRLREQRAPAADIVFELDLAPLETSRGKEVFTEKVRQHKPGLIVIDNLARAKTGKTDEDKSKDMADLVHWLQAFALTHKVAIVVIHHHPKKGTGDPGRDLRGTSAIGGAADINIGLYAESGKFRLRGSGRDIDSFDLRMDRITETKKWEVIGDRGRVTLEEENEDFREALEGEWLDATAIGERLGVSRQAAAQRAGRLVESGLVLVKTENRGQSRAKVYRWNE
jgi:hypothetical protein